MSAIVRPAKTPPPSTSATAMPRKAYSCGSWADLGVSSPSICTLRFNNPNGAALTTGKNRSLASPRTAGLIAPYPTPPYLARVVIAERSCTVDGETCRRLGTTVFLFCNDDMRARVHSAYQRLPTGAVKRWKLASRWRGVVKVKSTAVELCLADAVAFVTLGEVQM